MKTLKEALISKDKVKWASMIEHKYLNNDYVFLFIPTTFFDGYSYFLGKNSITPRHKVFYWILTFDQLKSHINNHRILSKISGEDYIYAVKKKEYKRISEDEFADIVDDWDYDDSEFNGWPRIPIDELITLKKK